MTLLTNLIAYWKLDEANGNATDVVGSVVLTNTNTATYSAGVINNGVNFASASSQSLTKTTDTFSPNGASARTISCWFKWTTLPSSGLRYIWSYGTFANSQACTVYGYTGATDLTIDLNVTAATATVPNMSTGTWYHLVVTYPGSGTTWKLYLNGTAYNLTIATPNTTRSNFCLGVNPPKNAGYLNGSVDEFGVWNRELSSTEVTALYNSGSGLAYPFGVVADTSQMFNLF